MAESSRASRVTGALVPVVSTVTGTLAPVCRRRWGRYRRHRGAARVIRTSPAPLAPVASTVTGRAEPVAGCAWAGHGGAGPARLYRHWSAGPGGFHGHMQVLGPVDWSALGPVTGALVRWFPLVTSALSPQVSAVIGIAFPATGLAGRAGPRRPRARALVACGRRRIGGRGSTGRRSGLALGARPRRSLALVRRCRRRRDFPAA